MFPIALAPSPSHKRLALHTGRLSFANPVSSQKLQFTAPLPAEMQRFLRADSSESDKIAKFLQPAVEYRLGRADQGAFAYEGRCHGIESPAKDAVLSGGIAAGFFFHTGVGH